MKRSSVRPPKILYIHPGAAPPDPMPERNLTYHLSKEMTGDLVTVCWDTRAEFRMNKEQYRRSVGDFGYHASLSTRLPPLARMLWQFLYFAGCCLWLTLKNGRYDAVVAYSPFKTAWAGLLVKALTRTPLIVQMTVNPFESLKHHGAPLSKFKHGLVPRTLPTLLRFTDHLHLLYDEQIESFEGLPVPNATAFPDFVATSLVPHDGLNGGYILFIGFPWKLKGVDILIQAFQRISSVFPDVRLKIVGHCPDRTPFERLARGNERIEFLMPMPNSQAMELMSQCHAFVLPSRTEGIPRVILEAWAAGKPVVASDVGGIPYLVRDGEDGLIFPSEDVDGLATALARIMSDPEEAAFMGRNGLARIEGGLTEEHYSTSFRRMVEEVRDSRRPARLRELKGWISADR